MLASSRDVVAVAGDAGAAAGGEREGALLTPHPLGLDEAGVRRDGDLAGVAVERHRASGGDAGGAAELDDRGDAHLRREDRGVARAAPGLGDDADDERAVERRRLRRGEVLGDDDARLGEVGHARGWHAEDSGDGAGPEVTQVGDPLGEVAAERLELGAVLLDRVRDGGGPAPAGGKLLVGGLDQTLVPGDQCGGVEDLLRRVVGVARLALQRLRGLTRTPPSRR